MKPIASFTVLLISLFSFQFTSAQSSLKTEKVKVNGKCEMCKNHIEKSARGAGARSARWDQETKFLQISYDPSVTNPVKIQSAIAAIGYDTQDVKAISNIKN